MGVLYLVRHGQASFGTANYDQLSKIGHRQADIVGSHLTSLGVTPTSLISGSMVRQQETAEGLLASMSRCADFRAGLSVELDDRWNELNASDIIAGLADGLKDPTYREDSKIFQTVLENACRRWFADESGADYVESFADFTSRVDAALTSALDLSGSGKTTVVATSSGVIAWVATRMVDGGVDQWLKFNRATINSSITKIIHGSAGSTMLTYNSHDHLPASLVTFR